MNVIESIHGGYVHGRRVRRLASAIAGLLPDSADVLDVGAGDGQLAALLNSLRPGLEITGVDVLVRPETAIPVREYDGAHIPLPDQGCDYMLLVDVLHHTGDPRVLLREGVRVARRGIIIKDHLREGLFAGATLRFMDRVGNCRHDVALPHNYWRREQWQAAFDELGLRPACWLSKLDLYPAPADWVFGRSLHFIALMERVAR